MSAPAQRAERVRAGVGLFRRDDRALIEVTGSDRVRWLNGMVSNDVAALAPGPEHSGCYALLLTPKARIVADLHVWCLADAFWLELAASVADEVRTRLESRVIADDVALADRSSEWTHLGLEGPEAVAVLERAGAALPELAEESIVETELDGGAFRVARVSTAREGGVQLCVPPALADALVAALRASAGAAWVDGDAETLEVLRIEAGRPRLGAELSEAVFPEEAGLVESAVSLTKGCYTGQEIVARIDSRGRVQRKLVALAIDGSTPPEFEAPLTRPGASGDVGFVTSACATTRGIRGLGFVKRDHAEAGTTLRCGDLAVQVDAGPRGSA